MLCGPLWNMSPTLFLALLLRVLSCLEKCVEFWALKNLQNPCQIFNRTSALKNKSHFSETQDLFIVSQVTRKTKPEIKQELQDWNYNFFEDFAMLGAPEKVAYNFKTLVNTRKCPLRGHILGVLMHTTAWDKHWGSYETFKRCGIFVSTKIRYPDSI